MKAIVIADKKLNWVDNEDPDCKDNEVIIKVKSTAVNRADLAEQDYTLLLLEQVKFLDLNAVGSFKKLGGMLLTEK